MLYIVIDYDIFSCYGKGGHFLLNRRKAIRILLVIICVVCVGVLGYRAYDLHVGHGSNEQALDLAQIPELAPSIDPNETEGKSGAKRS